MTSIGAAVSLAVLGLCGAAVATAATPGFSEQTDAAGLTFLHQPSADHFSGPMSGGGSVGDFNADGWPDLFVVGGGLTNDRVFINNQDGTFTDASFEWRLTAPNWPNLHRGTGSTVSDFNGDGWDDVYVTSWGDIDDVDTLEPAPAPGLHRLYLNTGNGRFINASLRAGVNVTTTANPGDGYGAAFGDYDLDGDLDLWVGGWHHAAEDNGNKLFRNDGNLRFTDVTEESGIFTTGTQGFGAIFVDMNGDRYPELLVAGDFGTSKYFINNRDGTFSNHDIWGPQGNGKAWNGMGTTIGDFNRDGRMDWFVTAIYPTWQFANSYWGNALYFNDGNHQMRTAPGETVGIQDGGWGWGTAAVDLDNDGWQDIVMTNGFPVNDDVTGETFTDEQAYLFHNNGDETFSEVALAWNLVHTQQGRGLVQFDYDRDGDMDIVMFSNADQLRLYRNDLTGPDTNWLQVVVEPGSNPAIAPGGFGANVRVISGEVIQHVRMNGGSNYLSRGESLAHFGVGGAETADTVLVHWADGYETILRDVAVNQRLVIAAEKPLTVTPLAVGELATLTIKGLAEGEVADFFFGRAQTVGKCYPYYGGLCSPIDDPSYMGSVTANSSGIASLTFTVSTNPAIETVHFQSLTRRGTGGIASLRSNVISQDLFGQPRQ